MSVSSFMGSGWRVAAVLLFALIACERGASTHNVATPSPSVSSVPSPADAAIASADSGVPGSAESESECAKAARAAKTPPPSPAALPLEFGNPKRPANPPSGLYEIAGNVYDAFPAVSADGKEVVFLWEGGADFTDMRFVGLDWYSVATGKRTKRVSLYDDSPLFAAQSAGKSESEVEAIRGRLRESQVNALASAKQVLAKSQWQHLEKGRQAEAACPGDAWEPLDRKRIEDNATQLALRFDAAGVDLELDAKNEHVLWVRSSPTQKSQSVKIVLPPAATTCGMAGKPPCGKPCGGPTSIEGWITSDRAFVLLGSEAMIAGDSCSATLYGDRFTLVRTQALK